jgi:hypothetical protein
MASDALIDFFAHRAVTGVDEVVDGSYRRSIALPRNPDAFMASDLGVLRGARKLGLPETPRALEHVAERWRPWRAYALLIPVEHMKRKTGTLGCGDNVLMIIEHEAGVR